MTKMTQTVGLSLLFGFVGTMMTSCMKDRGSEDFITKPYIKNEYYTDGTLYYDLDHKQASIIGTDGGASEIVVPNAISINDVIYPITRMKNLGVFTSKEDYLNHNGVTDNQSLRSLTVGYNVNSFSSDNGENPLFVKNQESLTEESSIYFPQTAPRYVRRYPLENISVWTGNATFDAREGCNAIIWSNQGKIMIGGATSSIHSSIKEIGDFAFVNSHNFLASPSHDNLIKVGESAFQNCGFVKLELPSSLESIGRCAFANNYLRTLSIPASVSEIGEYAFFDNMLETIIVEPDNKTFDSRDNCNAVIMTETNELIMGCDKTVIPDNVEIIGKGAFLECKTLNDVSWPKSLRRIDDYAFLRCEAFNQLDLPEGLDSIGVSAFYGCSELTIVSIPSTVTYIGKGAFRNCNQLAEYGSWVKLHTADPSAINPSVFSFSDDKKAFQLLVPKGSLNLYQDSRWSEYFQEIDEYVE